ncbi:ABC transporter substrate-binding protein, partial [Pseudanabaenaceae cyanobacterium LEGE 13415]|nr:ABC transporter substrate-binding protein [Pseudanabaenaceae cyanobacterium LEGE 13415]
TSGSDENFEQLEKGEADLAIVQADLPGGRTARTIAVLFEDMFQLIVQPKSGLNNFNDLAGHKIVLQPNSGEFYSFLELAEHYGMKLEDFQLTFATGAKAEDLFRQKQVDAMFRVRTLNKEQELHCIQERSHITSEIDQHLYQSWFLF